MRFISSMDEIVDELPKTLESGDCLLTLGAGDITQLGPRLLMALEAGHPGDSL